METLDPNSSPNKRLKTETPTLDPSISPSLAKGKAPIISYDDDDDIDSPAILQPQNCGICFSDEGKTVRGLIDSCDHYFCFLCIIEWSKIESRCPLCRGRFTTIRRVRKDGSFIGEGSVRVPVRDQIYDPFGEPVDPYGQAKCSVCKGTNDESLLLLCDLCDSAMHTYCVGLGATVPEGDWFCKDCALLRAEQHDSQMDDNMDGSTVSRHVDTEKDHVDEPQSTSAPVSIFDIVRDPILKNPNSGADRLLKLVSSHTTKLSSSAIVTDQMNISCSGSLRGARASSNSVVEMRDSSARTLRNCRNVHKHINVLRENWDAFRTGSMTFSSKVLHSTGKGSRRGNVTAASSGGSVRLQSSSSNSSLQSKAQDVRCDAPQNQRLYNVQRAWKLMNIAKSMKEANKSKGTSKNSHSKVHGLKVNNIVSDCVLSGKEDLITSGLGKQKPANNRNGRFDRNSRKFTGIVPVAASTSCSKYQNSCVPGLSTSRELLTPVQADVYKSRPFLTSHGKLSGGLSAAVDNPSACSTSSGGPMAGISDVSSINSQRTGVSTVPVKQVSNSNFCITSKGEEQSSAQADFWSDRVALPSHASVGRGLSNIPQERYGSASACSRSPYESMAGGSDGSCVKLEGEEMSAHPRESAPKITKTCTKDDEAKGEILSLVKLNLKLLSKDKQLGADSFKEIARLCTHTILAACGFEHRKIVRWLPTLVCHHGDQHKQLRRCTIVPNSCRECFYVFVNDVVNSIMSQKLSSTGDAT